jgi:hypothetical protein
VLIDLILPIFCRLQPIKAVIEQPSGVYLDCDKLDLAADCYTSALKIRHTWAHQGLARVHFLKNNRVTAFEEMTQLIEKAKKNASAYEKRSEYCDREQAMKDLEMVTRLDPLRVYPYRYRAAGEDFINCPELLIIKIM